MNSTNGRRCSWRPRWFARDSDSSQPEKLTSDDLWAIQAGPGARPAGEPQVVVGASGGIGPLVDEHRCRRPLTFALAALALRFFLGFDLAYEVAEAVDQPLPADAVLDESAQRALNGVEAMVYLVARPGKPESPQTA
jgi:hypothetical protein